MTYRLVSAASSIRVEIYMAGAIESAVAIAQDYCDGVGMCVSVEPLDYVYTGGREAGFRVGFINYPRFPSDEETIGRHAFALAERLAAALSQTSFSITSPNDTRWFSKDPEARQEASRPFRA